MAPASRPRRQLGSPLQLGDEVGAVHRAEPAHQVVARPGRPALHRHLPAPWAKRNLSSGAPTGKGVGSVASRATPRRQAAMAAPAVRANARPAAATRFSSA